MQHLLKKNWLNFTVQSTIEKTRKHHLKHFITFDLPSLVWDNPLQGQQCSHSERLLQGTIQDQSLPVTAVLWPERKRLLRWGLWSSRGPKKSDFCCRLTRRHTHHQWWDCNRKKHSNVEVWNKYLRLKKCTSECI